MGIHDPMKEAGDGAIAGADYHEPATDDEASATYDDTGRGGCTVAGILSSESAGIPATPAKPGETLQVGCERSLGAPIMGRDAPLGFGYFSLQPGDRLSLRLAVRTGDLAHPEPADFHRP